MPDSDISFVSSGRPSTDRLFPSVFNHNYNSESSFSNPRLSYSSDTDGNYSFESINYGRRSIDIANPDFSSFSHDSDGLSSSASNVVRTDFFLHNIFMYYKTIFFTI
jgi:hypothetical protein